MSGYYSFDPIYWAQYSTLPKNGTPVLNRPGFWWWNGCVEPVFHVESTGREPKLGPDDHAELRWTRVVARWSAKGKHDGA